MDIPQLSTILQNLGVGPGLGLTRLKPRLPLTAVHVGPSRISVVRVAPPAGKKGADPRPILEAYREMDLEPGLVSPALNQPNIAQPEVVGDLVRSLMEEVAPKEIRSSVVLPDSAARVSILRFNRKPANRREILDLIRFRLQKVLPFRVEEASLDFQLLSEKGEAEPEFLVALIQRQVLWQYERLLLAQDRMPGLVDLDSFNVANLIGRNGGSGSGEVGDEAVVNAADGYLTVLFFRRGILNFCRSKVLAEEELEDAQHFTAAIRRELTSCAAFYREHLSGEGFTHATLRSVRGDLEKVLATTTEELGCPTRVINPTLCVVLPEGANPADPCWQRLAPALGAALGRPR